jgi:hypothetical protein
MSAFERYQREPKPLCRLGRAQLAARVAVLREAIDILFTQAGMDGSVAFACLGSMKVCLLNYQDDLRQRDQKAPVQPFAAAAVDPDARRRLADAAAQIPAPSR